MSSLSAFTKRCPQCRSLLAADSALCACGHRFAAQSSNSSDLLTQAEELYETHLRARLQRAQRAAKLAKIDLIRASGEAVKRTQLQEAEKEVKLLETQLSIQSERVAEARAAAQRVHEEPAQEAPAAFRATQAAKAEDSFERVRFRLAAEQQRADEATAAFKAIQSEKAREAARPSTNDEQICPGCGSIVAPGVARCRCGFRLLAGGDAGGDFLSPEEFAALRTSER